jgi:pimeloyl-ACP methyl ester carboxylesterase
VAVRADRDDPAAVLPAEAVRVTEAVRVAEAGLSAIDDEPAASLPHAQTHRLTHTATTSDQPRITPRPRDEASWGARGHEKRVNTRQIIAHRAVRKACGAALMQRERRRDVFGEFGDAQPNGCAIVVFMPTLIFVHGACVRDAAWWWKSMTQPLADHGIDSVAVPLPSCGETGDELGDLYADVDACRQAIAAAEGPVVLCGHSYGGMIITEAGADDRVTQLLYVTSVMPDAEQSQADLIGSEPAPWLRPGDDGTVGVDPDMIREFFLQDCDETTAEQALGRLTRQSLTPFTQPPRQVAWLQKPSTYFVCTEDLATPAEVQRRRVGGNTRLVEFSAGHHPFLSRPHAFAHSIAAEIDHR